VSRAALLVVLSFTLAAPAAARAESRFQVETLWAGVALDVPVTTRPPLTMGLHFVDVGMVSASGRYQLQVPLLVAAWDHQTPSTTEASPSLSFVQAPLLFALAAWAVDGRDSVALEAVLGSLLWLSGGTFSYAPGGLGNLGPGGRGPSTWTLVARNEIALHPSPSPAYLRETILVGVGLRWERGLGGQGRVDPDYFCTLGAFASVAQEWHGRRARAPGVGATCSVGYIPFY